VSDLALHRQPGKFRLIGAVAGAGVVLAALAGYLLGPHINGGRHASTAGVPPAAVEGPHVSAAGLVQRSGVRISQLAISGGGGLVDLRYQVVDPEKANSVHDRATPPVLVDERTGLLVNELLMGHMHKGQMKAGQTYYLIFVNPGNLVRRGTPMTVQLGNAQVAHVRVQ
jgi:hypothetical protein